MIANPCYQNYIFNSVNALASDIISLRENQDFSIFDHAVAQVAAIQAGFEFCQISMKGLNSDDVIQDIGVGFLLASQCFQDLGGIFLIADTVITDPSDIQNDIAATIFVLLFGYQAYGDCGQLIQFILSL